MLGYLTWLELPGIISDVSSLLLLLGHVQQMLVPKYYKRYIFVHFKRVQQLTGTKILFNALHTAYDSRWESVLPIAILTRV